MWLIYGNHRVSISFCRRYMLTNFSDIMKNEFSIIYKIGITHYSLGCIVCDAFIMIVLAVIFIYIQKSVHYFLHASETFPCIINTYRQRYLSLIWLESVVLQPVPAKISDGASCNNFKLIYNCHLWENYAEIIHDFTPLLFLYTWLICGHDT